MHEMQSILTDFGGDCPSVTRLLGPWSIVLNVGPDLPTEKGTREEPNFKFWDPPIFHAAEARDLKFSVQPEGWGP